MKPDREPTGKTPAELDEARSEAERYLATLQEKRRQDEMNAAKQANAREQLAGFSTERDAERLAEAVKEARAVETSILEQIEALDEQRYKLNEQLRNQKQPPPVWNRN